jgi:Fic family protein
MLYAYNQLDAAETHVLNRVTEMRQQLGHFVQAEPRRWTGLLARMTRARALRASNSIEGINVTAEDALAAVDGEDLSDADRPTRLSVEGFQSAMKYILQRCRDGQFKFSLDLILSVHFMITQSDLKANPGNLRPGWVGVRNSQTGEVVHNGAERDQLEALLHELVVAMNSTKGSTVIRGALAHLNLTLLHPFSDRNGRTARCMQTAVLAHDGIVPPVFSSIEEYVGRYQQEYYDVLAEVGGGGWNPERSAKPFIRFCLTGHYRQAQTLLRRSQEMERVYGDVSTLIEQRGLPQRTDLAMVQAAFGLRVRNSSYRASADISNNLASRDLKALVDAGLLIGEGEKRGREYTASPAILAIRERHRIRRADDDPFARNGLAHEFNDSQQGVLDLGGAVTSA